MIEAIEKKECLMGFETAYESTKDEIVRVLSSAPVIVRQYTQHLLGAQGKHIRAIALLCASMDKQERIKQDAVKFAAATEILHLATLVHDDVIDNADIRRGIPTLQKKYGKRTAVICGDYLLSVALTLAASATDKKDYENLEMPDYVAQICIGELSQHIHSGDLDLSEIQYLKIISGKTAALFEFSFYLGAFLGGCTAAEAKQYKRLGWYTGMIFQIKDDCNDFESSREAAKKTVRSDYEQNVITLPLIHALQGSVFFKMKLQSGRVTRQQLNKSVRDLNGLSYAHSVAEKFYQKALRIASMLDMAEDKRTRILGILDKSMQL